MMQEKGGTLLIAERGGALSQNLDFWVTDRDTGSKPWTTLKDLLMTLQSEKINVLVMDVRLPEDMGYEAISIIKGLDRKLPIIITADENNPEQESRIRQQGIFYYHVNSFGPDDLILAISNAMVRSSQ